MNRDEAALVIAVAVGVQSSFSAAMPPLVELVRDQDPAAHLTAVQAAAARAGVIVALAAWLGRSKLVGLVGGALVAGDWWLYRKAATLSC